MLDAALNSNVICVLLLQVFSLASIISLVFVLTHQVLDNSSFVGCCCLFVCFCCYFGFFIGFFVWFFKKRQRVLASRLIL